MRSLIRATLRHMIHLLKRLWAKRDKRSSAQKCSDLDRLSEEMGGY